MPCDFEVISIDKLQGLLPDRCTKEEQQMLESGVTEEEIRQVLFSMPNNKSRGPYGFNSEFFKEVWPIIGKDFIVAVKSFLLRGFFQRV